MSDVRVTLSAESQLLLSEFAKVQESAGRLKKSVGDAGGVLEGDRRVEGKLTAWVDGFKNAQNGADLLANTMGNLGDVFKTSLAVGIGLNVGGALVGMFSSAITECENLKKSAEQTGAAIKDALASKDSGQISAMLKTANEEMAKLQERMKSWKPTLAPLEGMSVNLFQGQVDLGRELIVLMERENEIQSLINQGFTEEAALLAEKYRLEKEIAGIKKKGFATDLQLSDAIRATEEAGRLRVEAIKNKPIEEERSKRIKAADEKHAQVVAQAEKDIAAEQEAVEYFNEWKADEDAKVLAEREKSEKETAASLASWHIENEKKKWQAILDEATKQRKAIDDADKLALEGKREVLKEQQNIVKKGEQEQKQRDDRAMQALQGGGGLQALQAQRLTDRQAEAARDKAAGILARDEVRLAAGGDAMKMSAKDIAAVKARILGEKQLDKKKIEAAIDGIPKIEREIANLVAKLGVK